MQLTEVIRVRVWCPIKFLWFPFDVQNCETKFHLKDPLELAEVQFEFESDRISLVVPRWEIGDANCNSKDIELDSIIGMLYNYISALSNHFKNAKIFWLGRNTKVSKILLS